MEMTITRALNELKLLSTRIEQKTVKVDFIACKKNAAFKVDGARTVEEYVKDAKSEYQSIKDLIKRRKLIKTLIVESNATTKVTVSGKEMTVADAIERKSSIVYEERLLRAMEHNYTNVLSNLYDYNERVAQQRDEMIKAMGGKDKVNTEFIEKMSKKYEEENGWSLVDPLSLKKEIDLLRKDIEDFKSEVDFVLSESNAITKISVPD